MWEFGPLKNKPRPRVFSPVVKAGASPWAGGKPFLGQVGGGNLETISGQKKKKKKFFCIFSPIIVGGGEPPGSGALAGGLRQAPGPLDVGRGGVEGGARDS